MGGSRPFVIISAAVSVDGKIATRTGDSDMSSGADLDRLHKMRSMVDAILVGANTLRHDDPLLTVRRVRGSNPERIVLDPHGTALPRSRILRTAGDVPTTVVVSKAIPEARLRKLRALPVRVITCGRDQIGAAWLLGRLGARGIKTLLVEGGGTTNWSFVKAGLFDRLVVTISPRIIGGDDAASLVRGRGFASMRMATKLRLEKTERIGDELVLYYSVDCGDGSDRRRGQDETAGVPPALLRMVGRTAASK